MEYRRHPGCRNLAHSSARQGNLYRAELMGDWLRRRCTGRGCHFALRELAGSILRRNSAGAGHPVDTTKGTGIGDVAAAARSRQTNSTAIVTRKDRNFFRQWQVLENLPLAEEV